MDIIELQCAGRGTARLPSRQQEWVLIRDNRQQERTCIRIGVRTFLAAAIGRVGTECSAAGLFLRGDTLDEVPIVARLCYRLACYCSRTAIRVGPRAVPGRLT